MQFQILSTLIVIVFSWSPQPFQDESPEAVVSVPDEELSLAIRESLAQRNLETELLTADMLQKVRFLDCRKRNITRLTGLEACTQLSQLYLNDNQVVDLSPLESCSSLYLLDVSGNQIGDLSPLSKLQNLRYLNLNDNAVTELSALSQLRSLRSLHAERNLLTDVQGIAELSRLHSVFLGGNRLKSPRFGAGLQALATLDLSGNDIQDLAGLPGTPELLWILLEDNPVNEFGPLLELVTDYRSRSSTAPTNLVIRLGAGSVTKDSEPKIKQLRDMGVSISVKRPALNSDKADDDGEVEPNDVTLPDSSQ